MSTFIFFGLIPTVPDTLQIMNWHSLDQTFPPWLLLVGGATLGWLKNFWSTVYDHTFGFFVRKLYVALSVEESETEEPYLWLSLWAEKRIREKKITDLLLRRHIEREAVTYRAVPHYGTYYLRFRKRYLLVFNSTKEQGSTPDGHSMSFLRPRRAITISIFGTLKRSVITDLIDEAKAEFFSGLEKRIILYFNEGGWWNNREISPRPIDTIYLPERLTDAIVNDAKKFMSNRDQYRSLGIPWRRGYLLHGPPGTGKSSFVQALATVMEMPIYFLNLSSIDQPEELQRLFNSVSNRAILLLEDVDCIRAARERKEADEDSPASTKGIITSDLLNVIDGVVATEGRLLVMTTNHRDRLDSALLRKGRIDCEFNLSWAQDAELSRFHRRAHEMFSIPEYEVFREMLPEHTTIADAQEILFGEAMECERLELSVLN